MGESNNIGWRTQRYGKLSISHFGRNIIVMENLQLTHIKPVNDEFFTPHRICTICQRSDCGVDNASQAIDANHHSTERVGKPRTIWMFQNWIIGPSPIESSTQTHTLQQF